MFPKKKIGRLEITILVISIEVAIFFVAVDSFLPNLYSRFVVVFELLTGIALGLLSAAFLLYLQEKMHEKRLAEYYNQIAGRYTRIDIGQDNSKEGENENMRNKNVGLSICVKYLGDHTFKITAGYWRTEEGQAEVSATIEFNEKNGQVANGRYRYVKATDCKGHSGLYTIYRLEEDKTKLLVLFHHLFPRQNENNPDANRGWELWQRENDCM